MLTSSMHLFVALGLLAAPPTPPIPGPAEFVLYEEIKAQASPDADSQFRLALWCEARGLYAERAKHLALAVLRDPSHAAARGLMGLVWHEGRWKRPDVVAESVKADEDLVAKLAEYNSRRERAEESAESQWKLALWCEENGLVAEAKAHLTTVTRLDPGREAAWKRLGCKKVNGRWMTEGELESAKAEQAAQKSADKQWKPLLAKWRGWLSGKDAARRAEAERGLSEVTDTRAAQAVWSVFARGGLRDHALAVEVLGRIDAAESSRMLAYFSVFHDEAEIRRAATETLRRRDPREFAKLLVALIRDPIQYEVKPVGGPGSPGAIFIAGNQANIQRVYAPPALPNFGSFPTDSWSFDENGLPFITRAGPSQTLSGTRYQPIAAMNAGDFRSYQSDDPEIARALADFRGGRFGPDTPFLQIGPTNYGLRRINPGLADQVQGVKIGRLTSIHGTVQTQVVIPVGQILQEHQYAAASAQRQLEQDVEAIDRLNRQVGESNDRLTGVLREVAGSDAGKSRKDWETWYLSTVGYRSHGNPIELPRPTIVEDVPLEYLPQTPFATPRVTLNASASTSLDVRATSRIASCFGAGTAVRTLDGPRPIETLQVGDRVLTQDTRSGALGYQPITRVHHNPPSPTFLIKVKGDSIVSSPFHRFWVVGKGWVMARELQGGETLRLLDGPASVESVSEGPVQPVFNLDVADSHDFFAGVASALAHDNTMPDTRLRPFDSVTEVAAAGP